MSTTSQDRYLVGHLGAYDIATVARIDHHIRALRIYRLASRQQANRARHDVDMLLDARSTMTRTPDSAG